jgi:predicted small lipoprotein YifL
MLSRALSAFALVVALFTLAACNTKTGDLTYAGFKSKAELDQADQTVISESVGGRLDPAKLAPEPGRYNHNNIHYSQTEEGYYRWGMELYKMGYRDIYHVEDLAPRAFKRTVMDNNMNALVAGFKDTRSADNAK